MKKLRHLLSASVLFTVTAFGIACEGEDASSSVNNDNCGDELVELADILVTKSNTFSNSPTSSNCSAVRTAALNLLHAAENCDEYGYLYEEQTQYWVNLDCSEFD